MNGILLIDKPAGWTSSDVVAKLRGVLHEKRIGHSGTLDPMATGLLVLFVGRATRAAEFAESHDKRYLAALRLGRLQPCRAGLYAVLAQRGFFPVEELRLGLSTDTQDITGKPVGGSPRPVSREELEAVLGHFRGEILQVPPMYSAIKRKGQKLYEIARRGGEVEREARPVSIRALEIVGAENGDWLLDVRCSKGTYVRTLCHDIGEALGCGGCMSALRRTEAGDFKLENAHTLEQVIDAAARGEAEALLLPVDRLFARYPGLKVSPTGERKVRCGNRLRTASPEGSYRLYSESGEFLALVAIKNGEMRTLKSFFEVS